MMQATSKVAPQLVQPASGILMTNDLAGAKPEDVVPCFALSKNDSYVMSTSGGKISLFNMMTFKVGFGTELKVLNHGFVCTQFCHTSASF